MYLTPTPIYNNRDEMTIRLILSFSNLFNGFKFIIHHLYSMMDSKSKKEKNS